VFHPAPSPEAVEESPSTQVSPELRDQIGQCCARPFRRRYVNAGTIEFLMDEDRKLLLH